MNFVLERDGIAACPDDRARTDTPEPGITPKMVALMIDLHFRDIEQSVWDVLRGREEYAYVGAERFDKHELYELITENGEPDEMLIAMCGRSPFSGTSGLGDKLIEAWCHRKATELAEKELL